MHSAPAHQAHRFFEIVVAPARNSRNGHYIADLSMLGILAIGEYAQTQVAIGDDSDEHVRGSFSITGMNSMSLRFITEATASAVSNGTQQAGVVSIMLLTNMVLFLPCGAVTPHHIDGHHLLQSILRSTADLLAK